MKLYPDGVEKTLDEKEYARHVDEYGYSNDLKKAIEKSIAEVKRMIEEKDFPFSDDTIKAFYQSFLDQNPPILNRK